jgi:hypothetical protein
MMRILSKIAVLGAIWLFTGTFAFGQIPDVLNALDAGGRSLGMGGAIEGVDPSALSSYYNPASLGFLKRSDVQIDFRNLPGSHSQVSGSRSDQVFDSQGVSGPRTISDLSFAVPVSSLFRHGSGTLGFSYAIGGYINDTATGPQAGLADGPLTLQNYVAERYVLNDFYTLAYGVANSSKTASFGIGAIYSTAAVRFSESGNAVDSNNNPVNFPGANVSYNAHGFGAIIGAQIVPAGTPNFSLGASFRTPISLTDTGPGGIYDRIPGRFLASASYRLDNVSRGGDFILLGSQYQDFFGGEASYAFDRTSQTVAGVGLEYDHVMGSFRIPLRIGYESVGGGGNMFGSRNLLTYGIGYRPLSDGYSIDLNMATASSGGTDFDLSAAYRFKQ